ncbi:hypothetical protein GLV89_11355 [Halomonas alkaliantarctica]|nr:hypothetical protein [Halomonas alkaliantarctica]
MHPETSQQVSPETSKAFQYGYIIVYDIKEGMDLQQDEVIQGCSDAYEMCSPMLFQAYIHQEDEEDPQGRRLVDIEPKEELEEGFQELASNFMFFRVSQEYQDSDLDEILSVCRERSFWQPWYVFRKGELVELPSGLTLRP